MDTKTHSDDRRQFLQTSLASVASVAFVEQTAGSAEKEGGDKKPYNMVLIISDQESYGLNRPKDYELAARAGAAPPGHVV